VRSSGRRRVLVADDHPPSRAGVRLALEGKGFEIVVEAANARTAVEGAVRERPDICLLEIRLPGNGITAARQISALVPSAAIVMLSVSDRQADVLAALRAGAIGYLLKTVDPERLPHALQGVLDGEAALPRRLTAALIDEFRALGGHSRRPALINRSFVTLTPREWDVADLLCADFTTGQIAAQLGLADVTVRRHISEIMRKVDAPNRRTAVGLLKASAAPG
jgi:DNA-binding NarL/FixJ family response regulator